MLRRALCLLALSSAAFAAAFTVNFANWDRSRWLPVREPRFPVIVPFVQCDGCIENYLEPGREEKDIVGMKDGIGAAMLMLRDFRAADLTARCELAFERKGAPALMLRSQREGDLTGSMYSLVVYERGLNLWKCDAGKWSKVGASEFDVAPGVFHDLRVYVRGNTFSIYLNGEHRLVCADPAPLAEGEVGLWSGEGPCRFRSFSVRSL